MGSVSAVFADQQGSRAVQPAPRVRTPALKNALTAPANHSASMFMSRGNCSGTTDPPSLVRLPP